MLMKIESITANLLTDDMVGTLEFYCNVLNFTVVMHVPDEPPFGWAMLQNEGVMVMVQSRESLGEDMGLFEDDDTGGSLVFYSKVKDLDGWWELLREKATIFMDPRTTFYGAREFGFLDNNGYRYVFAQDTEAGQG